MLSYQHKFHAGNHADLLKHTALSLILDSLCKKEKPFTVIDTHAGNGIYFLDDESIQKTGEARQGIEKIWSFTKKTSLTLPEGIQIYLDIQNDFLNKRQYAGSPQIERMFLRQKDIVHLIEKHPESVEALRQNTKAKTDGKTMIHDKDSYECLKELLPPLVKRGLILIDPSYEDKSDWQNVTMAIKEAHKKWNTAIIALWYPLLLRRKNENAQMLTELDDFCKLQLNQSETLRCEFCVTEPDEETAEEKASHLYGSGMFIINPPWQLKEKLEECISFYSKVLAY